MKKNKKTTKKTTNPTKKPSEDFWAWIANLRQKYWVGDILLVKASTLWFPLVLTYLGNKLDLTGTSANDHRHLTMRGWAVTIFLFLLVIICEISSKREKRKEDDAKLKANNNYYRQGYLYQIRLRKKNNKLCTQRCQMLLNRIHSIKSAPRKNSPKGVYNPKKQLETIVSELTDCLVPFFAELSPNEKWSENDIFISIAYQFPAESGTWEWATEERGLSLNELLAVDPQEKSQSTFSYLLGHKKNTIFFNSKQKAYKEGHYIPDEFDRYDQTGNLLGSIVSYKRVQKTHDIKYTCFILSITSYSKKFVPGASKNDIANAEHNMYDLIVSDFLKRIDEELCWLYLQSLENP